MITLSYAALLSLLFVFLSIRTIRLRRGAQVSIGGGGVPALEKAARAHANFAEYAPLCLLMMYFLEPQVMSLDSGPLTMHALGLVLLAGRSAHAYGVSQVKEDYRFRVTGMFATFIVLLYCSFAILVLKVLQVFGVMTL